MTSRERVLSCIRGQPVDRVPLNVFAGWNPGIRAAVSEKYGDIHGFCDAHHIDVVTGVLPRFPFAEPAGSLAEYLTMDVVDPASPALLDVACDAEEGLFLSVSEALRHQGGGKAVFVHAWGVFELSQFLFERDGMPGTQDALMNMIADQDRTAEMYMRLGSWSAACVERAIQAGADVIELSDDWGQQDTMLFSPKLWRELIMPATKLIVDVAARYNVPVLLHSDGDITLILEDLRNLGLSGLHPVQESAGMSYQHTREVLGKKFCIMGGLDTVTALPVMTAAEVRTEVRRVFDALKPGGPFVFAGSHMFQDDAPLDVIEAAYQEAYLCAEY